MRPLLKLEKLQRSETYILSLNAARTFNSTKMKLKVRELGKLWIIWVCPQQSKNQFHRIECLSMFQHNKADFLLHLFSMDEVYVHHFVPEIKLFYTDINFHYQKTVTNKKILQTTNISNIKRELNYNKHV